MLGYADPSRNVCHGDTPVDVHDRVEGGHRVHGRRLTAGHE
jgi:hypothetical protein